MIKNIYILLIFSILFSIKILSQNSQQQEIYQAFISRSIPKWEAATLKLEKNTDINNTAELLNLIHCYYGWTSEFIDKKMYKNAEANIVKVENWIEKILAKDPNNALAINFKGVFISYRLAFEKSKVFTLGKQSLQLIKKAHTLDPTNVQVLFDNGNAYYYPPKIFGGDKKTALMHYQKAISILERQNNTSYNWVYVQMLMLAARCNDLLGNTNEAKKGYEKTLRIEPNFKIVKEKYYPEILRK
ncbi:MAG: hypothetical protein GX102_04800 [Porphyromonadaceae bacterium]|nr:hypothetical protein [Porphyromonadaceae bacterium]